MSRDGGVEARPRVGVLTFPGSLDDRDAARAVELMGGEAVSIWHADDDLHGADAVILPGGFSYGDYLRTGAIARFARAMDAVARFAEDGGPVLGICNGFQILCEAGLLPGALIRNRGLSFVCRWIHIRAETSPSGFGGFSSFAPGEILHIPIKHGEGQFVASADDLASLEDLGLVAFRYCAPDGTVSDAYNPNGATNAIAGLRSQAGNVLGLMPHPEHAVDAMTGSTDGLRIFAGVAEALV
jgi:phosphoribosylformylglycinamidine synthase I